MESVSDLATKCIRCGFCLESCPTFVLTGEETESPRGRIHLIRSADLGRVAWRELAPHIDRCLGCRACETACPSGVEYGELLTIARDRLEMEQPRRARALLLAILTRRALLKPLMIVGRIYRGKRLPYFLSMRLSGQIATAEVPRIGPKAQWPPLEMNATKGQVALLRGCAQPVLFPRVTSATERLVQRLGFEPMSVDLGCCGALHGHNGHSAAGQRMARSVLERAAGKPIITDSAGCGSWLKESIGANIYDLSEFLVAHGMIDALKESDGCEITVTYHDACHLAHGQGIRQGPRDLLAAIPGVRLVPLAEADMCCGSAGIYNLTQPHLAARMQNRKLDAIRDSGAHAVVLGNPGCQAWIAQGLRERHSTVPVFHLAEMLEASFSGLPFDLRKKGLSPFSS